MKIRNGFVSNSSSSSFVIAFKDKKVADIFKKVFNHYDYSESIQQYKKEGNLTFDNIVVLSIPFGAEDMLKFFDNRENGKTEDFECFYPLQ